MKTIAIMFILLAAGSTAFGQTIMSGDLTAHVDSIINAAPGTTPAGLYLQPSSATRTIWRGIIQDILAGDYATADASAANRSYRVVLFTDTGVHPGKQYIVLERTPDATAYYWGTFIFDPYPRRDKLVIECPHAKYDSNTGREGFRVFTTAGARAYFVNGVHRCNGTTASPCDGTTTACDDVDQAYRYSDQAHVTLGTFQLTTEEMLAVYPDLIIIQPHGFSKETGDPDLIMSNGSSYTPTVDYLPTLRDNLLLQDASLTFKICHLDNWSRLIARDNVQGRLINGSPDPCGDAATSSTGRFLSLEQAYSKLRDTQAHWYKLANAVAATFPVTGQTVTTHSGQWLDAATWSSDVVPTEGEDIRILGGHTVTVDGTTPECHTITFDAPSAYLEMEDHSRLTINGDFVIASPSQDAFAEGWSWLDARLVFAGDEAQTLTGWGPGANATSFRDVTIDKPDQQVATAGNGMKLVVNNSLDLDQGNFTIAAGDTVAIDGLLSLNDGNLINSAAGAVLMLGDGATISRDLGVIQNRVPLFGSTVNLEYVNGSAITTGPECPADSAALNNLTIAGNQAVQLSADAVVNGDLVITGGSLNTNGHVVTLGSAATLQEDTDHGVEGLIRTTRELSQGIADDFGGLGLELNASAAAPGETAVARVTGAPQTLDDVQGIACYFDITPDVNSGLDATLVFHYRDDELNGIEKDNLSLYSSDDGGSSWTKRGGTIDASANTVTLGGISSLSRWTLGPAETGCCTGMVGDANLKDGDLPTIGDISVIIDALFISSSPEPIACFAEADVNQSGGTNPGYSDITIGDISILIDYLFISGPDSFDGGWGVGHLAPCH